MTLALESSRGWPAYCGPRNAIRFLLCTRNVGVEKQRRLFNEKIPLAATSIRTNRACRQESAPHMNALAPDKIAQWKFDGLFVAVSAPRCRGAATLPSWCAAFRDVAGFAYQCASRYS